MNSYMIKHGDAVRDIAFTVDDARAIYEFAVSNGAISVHPPTQISDENGVVVISSVRTYG